VRRLVDSGQFESEEAALAAALDLLVAYERKYEALRCDIQLGIDQLDRGEGRPLDVDDLKLRIRRRLEREKRLAVKG